MLLAQYLSCNPLIIMIIIIMARGRNQYTDGTGCNGKKRINDESQGFISWHWSISRKLRIQRLFTINPFNVFNLIYRRLTQQHPAAQTHRFKCTLSWVPLIHHFHQELNISTSLQVDIYSWFSVDDFWKLLLCSCFSSISQPACLLIAFPISHYLIMFPTMKTLSTQSL